MRAFESGCWLFEIPSPGEWVMAGYTTMNSFFDESGKFKDHKIISFGGIADYGEQVIPFAREWGQLLSKNGLKEISTKKAFRAHIPLSDKNQRTGKRKRIDDLLPFIACIRKHVQLVMGISVDVETYKKLPSHFFQSYGTDPSFIAFARSMLHLVDYTPDADRIGFICDDDEETAFPFYRLYRRIKKVWPQAKKKLSGISFVDDSVLFGLQAADLIASIMRLEAGRQLLHVPYDYVPLFRALTKNPERHERLMKLDIAICDRAALIKIAEGLEAARKKAKA